jgi:hypothetical protein
VLIFIGKQHRVLAHDGPKYLVTFPGVQVRRVGSKDLLDVLGPTEHHDAVIQPLLRFWGIFERTDFGPAGEHARDELSFFLAMLDAKAKHHEEKRAAREEARRTA